MFDMTTMMILIGSNISRDMDMDVILNEINAHEVQTLYPLIVFYTFILCIGLFGNALVLLVYSYRFRRSPARVYILFLATIDFLICSFGLPYHVIDLTHPYTYTNALACKSLTFIMTTLFYMSIFGLIVIAIDRYLKICRPLGKLQISYFGKRRACLVTIICAVLLSWPNLVLYGRSEMETSVPNVTGYACFFSTNYLESNYPLIYILSILIVCIGSTGFLIITYSLICHRICTRYQKDTFSYQTADCHNGHSVCTQIEHAKTRANTEPDLLELEQIHLNKTSDEAEINHSTLDKTGCDSDQLNICNTSKGDNKFESSGPKEDSSTHQKLLEHCCPVSDKDNEETNKGNSVFNILKSFSYFGHQTESNDSKMMKITNEDHGNLVKRTVYQSHESLIHHTLSKRISDKYPSDYGSLQHIPWTKMNNSTLLFPSRKSHSMRAYPSESKNRKQYDSASSRDLRRELLTGHTDRSEGLRIHSRDTSRRSSLDGSSRDHSSPNKQHGKITRIMLTVTTVFIISYTPSLIVTIWTSIQPEFWDLLNSSETIACEFFLRFYLINNICNPFIYGFWDKRFKREIVYTLRKIYLRLINTCTCCCSKTTPS